MSQGLTLLLPFTPAPQAVENHSGQEDGKESRKPRKDGVALVFLSVRKNKRHARALGGWGGWRRGFLQEWERLDLGWEPGEGKLKGVGCVAEERLFFVDRGNRTQEKAAIPFECLLDAMPLHGCDAHFFFTTIASLLGARNLRLDSARQSSRSKIAR